MTYQPYGRYPQTKGEAYRYALRHRRRQARGRKTHAYSLDATGLLLCSVGKHVASVTGHISAVTCKRCLAKLADKATRERYTP